MLNFKPTHLLLALMTVVIWGVNFVVLKLALVEAPPIFLCALRFIFSVLPVIFFIKKPKLPWKSIAQYGFFVFAFQFFFLFTGMHFGVSAGLASAVLQIQVFITIGLSALFLGEKPTLLQIVGACFAFVGMIVVGMHVGTGTDVTWLGLIFVVLAAFSWGYGNIIAKRLNQKNALSLVVWGSLFAIFPLLFLSLVLEGPTRITSFFESMTWVSVFSVFYQAYASTLIGYGIWSWLLVRYPASSVAPLTLLVPIVGMLAAILVLGESLYMWKVWAIIFILGGLSLNVFSSTLSKILKLRYEIKK
jgi:O-acetylserine/cysteine efflux transporter